jgi:hypothetical protein
MTARALGKTQVTLAKGSPVRQQSYFLTTKSEMGALPSACADDTSGTRLRFC